jgi:hypothetical protein
MKRNSLALTGATAWLTGLEVHNVAVDALAGHR